MKNPCVIKEKCDTYGFTLVEVVFSLALVGFCLVGLLTLFSQGMKQAQALRWLDRSTLMASSLFAQLRVVDTENTCAWIQTRSDPLKIPLHLDQKYEIAYGSDFLPLGNAGLFDSDSLGCLVELHTLPDIPYPGLATCVVSIRRSPLSPDPHIFSSIVSKEGL